MLKRWIKNRTTRFFFSFLMALLLGFLLLNALFPLPKIKPFSTIITDSKGQIVHVFLSKDDKWRLFTELSEINPTLRKAIIAKEDRYFYYHLGINPLAIARALVNNILKQKRTSGASTITMQVARLLEPKRRTYGNKIVELFRATQLECHYSKAEILQLYLNLVPYGGNVEGVKSAAMLYFDKLPQNLSLAEVVTLVVVPNRPNTFKINQNNTKLFAERQRWLNYFLSQNTFDKTDILDALQEPMRCLRRELPRFAPHFAIRQKNEHPNQPIIKTSLDLNKQKTIERLTKNYIANLYIKNIRNAAVLVINNQTSQIEAYIGSADFQNRSDGGQVDGIRALRSPGSTLKPLVYGLAMDKGFITPKTTVADVPVNYFGYEPVNFNQQFNGNVSVEFALANSLNIPAVKILEQITLDTLFKAMQKIGFKNVLKNKKTMGLSVALGGCSVTLEDMTWLYWAFANGGKTSNDDILSEESTFLLTQILTQLTRPELPSQWQNAINMPKIAWKTGTSYGRKDAWSIGYNRQYTIGVWIGNFSGQGVAELTGATVAAPLLFQIFNAIDLNTTQEAFEMPKNLDFRLVCAETGQIPNDFCHNQVMDYYIPTVSSNKLCEHLEMHSVSADSSISFCTNCQPENGFKKKYYPNYSPQMLHYFNEYHLPYQKIPTHNPNCDRIFAQNAPEITSPLQNKTYFVDVTDSLQLLLQCNAANDVEKVFWYIDNQFYKQANVTQKIFFTPKSGIITITCVDDKGRKSSLKTTTQNVNF